MSISTINLGVMDKEILSNVINRNQPSFKIYDSDINDEYSMRLSISSNSVILYEIEQI